MLQRERGYLEQERGRRISKPSSMGLPLCPSTPHILEESGVLGRWTVDGMTLTLMGFDKGELWEDR